MSRPSAFFVHDLHPNARFAPPGGAAAGKFSQHFRSIASQSRAAIATLEAAPPGMQDAHFPSGMRPASVIAVTA
jgi:hypothetical protein